MAGGASGKAVGDSCLFFYLITFGVKHLHFGSISFRPAADGLLPSRVLLLQVFATVRSGGSVGPVLLVASSLGVGDRAHSASQSVPGLQDPTVAPSGPHSPPHPHTRIRQCQGKRGPVLCYPEGLAPFWGAVSVGDGSGLSPHLTKDRARYPPWVASSLTHPAFIFP